MGRFRRLRLPALGWFSLLALGSWLSAIGIQFFALTWKVPSMEEPVEEQPFRAASGMGKGSGLQPQELEVKGESAPNGARRVHKKDRLPILPEDRNIPLGQEIADVD